MKMKLNHQRYFKRVEESTLKNEGDSSWGEYLDDQSWDYPLYFYAYETFQNTFKIKPTPRYDGEILIRYYANLPSFKKSSEFPNKEGDPGYLSQAPVGLMPRFHKLLSLYVAFRYWQNWKDESQQVNELREEYYTLKAELASETLKKKNKHRSRTVRRLHDFL